MHCLLVFLGSNIGMREQECLMQICWPMPECTGGYVGVGGSLRTMD
jgi:hypothetical protein